MDKNKIVRRLIPVSLYNMAAYESWLEHMASKGLFLEGYGMVFAHFRKAEPQQMTYRLEPLGSSESVDTEVHASYIQSGWEYVTDIKGNFSIYGINSSEAAEVHTDFIAQSYTYEGLYHKLRGNAILVGLMGLVIIGMIIGLYLLHDEPVLYVVEYGSFVSQTLYVIIEIFIVARTILDAGRIKKAMRQLRSGIPLLRHKNYKRSRNWHMAAYSLLIGIFVTAMVITYEEMNRSWQKPAAELDFALPVISLENLEDDGRFEYMETDSYRGRYYENMVEYQWTVLAPVQYVIEQNGKIEGVLWADESGVYEPSLRTSYYEVISKYLSEPLLKDLINRYAVRYEEMTLEELESDEFDRAVLASDGESQYLFACKGREVIFLRYHGQVQLASQLKDIAESL